MTKKPKRVPLGPAPKRTDEMRRALATVTPELQMRAEELWDENCPPEARGLLAAEPKKDDKAK